MTKKGAGAAKTGGAQTALFGIFNRTSVYHRPRCDDTVAILGLFGRAAPQQ